MLKEKKYFLFDIDGTLAVGETLYDGTKRIPGMDRAVRRPQFLHYEQFNKEQKRLRGTNLPDGESIRWRTSL